MLYYIYFISYYAMILYDMICYNMMRDDMI